MNDGANDSRNVEMVDMIALARNPSPQRQARLPAVFWREKAKQFMAYIGYHIARKGRNSGRRVRTPHYLGRDESAAMLKAITITQEWREIVKGWGGGDEFLRSLGVPAVSLGEDCRPVWPAQTHRLPFEPTREVLEAQGRMLNVGDEQSETFMSVVRLSQKYLESLHARVGLLGRRGLKPYSYLCAKRALERSLAGVDGERNILTLTRDDMRSFVDYWMSPDRGIRERTAAGYCRAFKAMIEWADNESACGFTKPKMDDLFSFSNIRGEIQMFNAEQMKKLLAAAGERCRLYILLGLNTGYTQIDLANLRRDELVEIGGEAFMVRRREKTSHQNDFRTKHYLWPETWELLKRHMAPENADNLVFLNVNGKKIKRGKTDSIRDVMDRAREASGVREITFKQLRKFGVTAVHRLTRLPDVGRMYASHKIHGVLGNYDRDDNFDPLTEALKKWRLELKEQGVL